MAISKAKDNSAGRQRRPAEWLVVRNLTPQIVTIPSDDPDMAGRDIVLKAHEAKAVRVEDWDGDINIETMVGLGKVAIERSASKPRPVPRRPASAELSDPRLNMMVWEIVFGEEAMARDFITANPTLINRPGTPVDREWLKTTGWSVLHGALDWLKAWGKNTHRIAMIEARIEEIRLMP